MFWNTHAGILIAASCVRLSIDDFGTGNSSLAQLRELPFDELKIDQSFVHGAWNNEKLRAMFDSSLGLAKQLGMESVAEGVEDQADWDLVRKSGCDIAQAILSPGRCPPPTCPAGFSPGKQLAAYPRKFLKENRYGYEKQ